MSANENSTSVHTNFLLGHVLTPERISIYRGKNSATRSRFSGLAGRCLTRVLKGTRGTTPLVFGLRLGLLALFHFTFWWWGQPRIFYDVEAAWAPPHVLPLTLDADVDIKLAQFYFIVMKSVSPPWKCEP